MTHHDFSSAMTPCHHHTMPTAPPATTHGHHHHHSIPTAPPVMTHGHHHHHNNHHTHQPEALPVFPFPYAYQPSSTTRQQQSELPTADGASVVEPRTDDCLTHGHQHTMPAASPAITHGHHHNPHHGYPPAALHISNTYHPSSTTSQPPSVLPTTAGTLVVRRRKNGCCEAFMVVIVVVVLIVVFTVIFR